MNNSRTIYEHDKSWKAIKIDTFAVKIIPELKLARVSGYIRKRYI